MERTKYTPKRLLSLLLALIMLLGMFPTAVFAAEPAGGIVLNSDEYKAHGLIFKFEPILPDGPYIMDESKDFRVHYTISTATGDDYVEITELKQFARYNNAETGMIAGSEVSDKKANDSAYSEITKEVTTADGSQSVKVFNPGVVIVEGDITGSNSIISDENNTGRLLQHIYFAAEWHGVLSTDIYNTNETEGENSIKTMTVSARYLPLGYSVSYNDGGYTGQAGIPVGTFRTTGSDKNNQSFTISDVTPTLAGCTFKGWSSDTWENKDADGNPVLFQPGDKVEKVGSDTVLTAVWEPTETTNTHTVSFVADVTGVSQLPDAIIVEHGTKIPTDKVPTVDPIREGYNFKWWTDNLTTKAEYKFADAIMDDVKLYPVWEHEQVSISLDNNSNGTVNPVDWPKWFDLNSTVNFTLTLEEGYELPTVTVNGSPLAATVGATTNGKTTYHYSFVANAEKDKDGNRTMTVTVGQTQLRKVTIALPTGDGFRATFTGCTGTALKANGRTSYTFNYGEEFQISLKADPNVTAYLYTNDTNDEDAHLTITNNTTTCTNHKHKATDDFQVDGYADKTYFYRVEYVMIPQGGIYVSQSVQAGSSILTAPAKPNIDGYNFIGWYKDPQCTTGQEWVFGNEATEGSGKTATTVDHDNTIIYGKFEAKRYDIRYVANTPQGVSDTDEMNMRLSMPGDDLVMENGGKEHGKPYPISKKEPTLTGYDFKGWATSATGPVAYQPGEQYLIDADLTLYAVWAKKTYTVTVSSGTGYSTTPSGTTTVAHGDDLTITIVVDRQYSATKPTVTDNGKDVSNAIVEESPVKEGFFYKKCYTYTLSNVQDTHTILINVAQNPVYQVPYYIAKSDNANGTDAVKESKAFMIQSVEYGYYASMPAAPEVSGYKFHHWERHNKEGKVQLEENAVFTVEITEEGVEFWAVYVPIVPVITVANGKQVCDNDYSDGEHTHDSGWGLENWKHGTTPVTSTAMTPVKGSDSLTFNIAYGEDVAFDLVIDAGYDYSQLSVAANGLSMGLGDSITLNSDGSTTIHYVLNRVTGDTRITVSGIKRKTITINYFANAGDDVANVPGPETVNYWIENDKNNGYISKIEPKRNGYTFLGWCEVPTGTKEQEQRDTNGKLTGYKVGETTYPLYKPGDPATFTKDTNLYAIWEAADLTVDLLISDKFIDYTSTSSNYKKLDYAYEGEKIYLTGKLGEKAQGTMTFYKHQKTAPDTEWTVIGTVTVNGGLYGTIETTAEAYQWDHADNGPNNKYRWDYKVEFTPTNEEGYKECKAQDDLRVYSKAISWELNKDDKTKWTLKDEKANQLTVYTNEACTDEADKGVMVAGKTYWLQIPNVVELDGGLALENKKNYEENGKNYSEGYPKSVNVGEHYEIIWEYEDSKDHWKTYTTTSDTDWVKITEEYSGYSFRAKVTPTKVGIYDKAATYDENDTVVKNVYWDYLITEATSKTAREDTEITLAVEGAEDESKSVKINGGTPFSEIGNHKAQYEGQKITLVATVKKAGTDDKLTMGTVEFFRKNGDKWESIGTAPVQPDATGVGTAALEVEMSAFDNRTATTALDEFYAKYVENETYKESATYTPAAGTEDAKGETTVVYIKSAQLKTPVIMDADKPTAHKGYWLNGETKVANETEDKTETTYNYHLGGLMAGIPHTFELKKTGSTPATGDWSVVALDGRAVPEGMYTMKWWTLTDGKNWNETTTDDPAFSVGDTKFGERYRIRLTGKGVFDGSVQDSKDIVIGELQGVVVTVVAIDAIKKTDETDVYQLNDITLTAKVEAAEQNAESKPEGTVAFYYADTANNQTVYKYLGEATLQPDTNGDKVATIKTNELPVKPDDNTHRDVTITAVYFGDATFEASAEITDLKDGKYQIEAADGCTTINDEVTVYSSVVYNCKEHENTLTTEKLTDKGIHISVSDGVFKTNNEATLKLSDIYTLDCTATGLSENMLKLIAKLDPNTDFEIQWQKLTGATAYTDGNVEIGKSQRWTNIDGEKNGTITLTVEQNTAYRAVITVKDQPITKGSFTEVDQVIDGRKVYYSNILMPTDANITMSVMVNTDKNGENLEGITEGETVTANVFLSGAVGSVPNAEIEVLIEVDESKGNTVEYTKTFTKATVNGWNSIDWDTKGVEPGFYTMKITAKTNTGYATKEFERSLIVRESSYTFDVDNTTTTYNGQTQGVTVELNGFHFNGKDIDDAAAKSWTVKYYKDATIVDGKHQGGTQVEPSQAGTYVAEVTLPGSAYWTELTKAVEFTISKRSVHIADAVAQAKVYDGTKDVNIVEVILNDAETEQTTTGLPKDSESTGIINGDSIYAVVAEDGATLNSENAGSNGFKITKIDLLGDDKENYVGDKQPYTEPIYVSRSQVYGEIPTYLEKDISLKISKDEKDPVAKVSEAIKMIDQAGNKLELDKDYKLTFYYHSDTQIKQTTDLSQLGLYTVVARPDQSNYKSGVTMKFEVVNDATEMGTLNDPKPSTLITISNTAELYGHDVKGVTATATNGATIDPNAIEYLGTTEKDASKLNAGRYIVKVTASTGDVAYGIYTITKAHPIISITAENAEYNSSPYNKAKAKVPANTESYLTYAGDVAIGYYATEADQKNGNVAEQAPVDAGDYVVTLHVNETTNYTAHEVSAPFTIKKKDLTIKADSRKTTQYDAFPTMTATYDGLAAETNDGTPDTSLRDVQIAPEFIYNPTADGKPDYNNNTLDQVGKVAVKPVDALSKNYAITYVNGEYVKSATESNPDLEILGLPQSGEKNATTGKYVAKVYYGDEIQLYPYGNYAGWANGSSEFKWEITNKNITNNHGDFTIGETTGILNVGAIGTFTVKLTRGEGEQKIETSVTVEAIRKEAKIALKEVDKVYNGDDQTYDFANITVHDDLYKEITSFPEGKLVRTDLSRKNIGTQIPTATVNTTTTGSWYYQSETYGGQFTINDKEATVAPGAQSTVYGTLETFDENPTWTVTGEANGVKAVDNVNVASQTDVYDRLDVYDGYEILVAGTEDINYNVKYTTDHKETAKDAKDSAVTIYDGVKFTSKTIKELNDATVYGETPNALDWTLDDERYSTRSGSEYHDNLADFNLPTIFVYQVYDNCIGNAKTYKAANRTTTPPDKFNVGVLDPNGGRTSAPDLTFETLISLNNNPTHNNEGTDAHPNYTLFFNVNGVSEDVKNYTMNNAKTGNASDTTKALGTLGYDGGNDTLVKSENFVEGSANIAQRPVTVYKDPSLTGDITLYWKLPQKDLYTALLNILKADGLADGHTIKDLDLQFTIHAGEDYTVKKDSENAIDFNTSTFPTDGKVTVTVKVGDTNYVLNGNGEIKDIVLRRIQIEATYTEKTATGFTVLIKVRNADNSTRPLTAEEAKGLSYKIFRKVNGSFDNVTYAQGTLTATNRTAYDRFGDLCGVFTAKYKDLPNISGTYFIQMYEYGVELKTGTN